MKTETTTDNLTLRAQNLRIGNLVHYKVFDEVSGDESNEENIIDSQDIEQIWQLNRSGGSGAYSPIPLTEETLIRLGFERKSDGRFYNKENKFYPGYLRGNFFNFVGMPLEAKDCQFIHQLQNLFFALTGEELTLTK